MDNKILIIALSLIFSTFVRADDSLGLYSGVAKKWKVQISKAFDVAEKEVYNVLVVPDEEILKPDPDAKKCPCRGTGKIIHGDGHATECLFHGKSSSVDNCADGKCSLLIKKTTCQCETRCSCKICECNKLEIN